MGKLSRNECLGIVFGLAFGFLLCAILVGAWPYADEMTNYGGNYPGEGRSEYQEVPVTWDEFVRNIWTRTIDDPMAFYGLWVAVFTFVLGVGTFFLWYEARKSSQNELRAYVGAIGADTRPVAIGLWGTRIDFKNKGQTPAHNVEFGIDVALLDLPLPTGFVFKMPSLGHERWTMVPDAITSPETRLQIRDVKELLEERKAIFVWGEITYVDVFGERAFVPFRYRVRYTLMGWELRPEQQGNQSQFPKA